MQRMLSQAFAAGYVLYIFVIFLPGIGLGELLGVWQEKDLISERLALAFGLGLSCDAVVLFIKTSGVGGLAGIDSGTLYGISLAGLILGLVSVGIRRKFTFPRKPNRTDLELFIIIGLLIALLFIYFQQYPIFPEYQSPDFKNHVELAQALIVGSFTSLPQGILYNGIRFQLASAILLVAGEPLVTSRITMALLACFSPLLVFAASKKIFENNNTVGLLAALIYSLSGSIWFPMLLDSGLYANFYGVLSALFLLIVFFAVIQYPKSALTWILFLVAVVNSYVSHYTILTLFPVLLIAPLIQYFLHRRSIGIKGNNQFKSRNVIDDHQFRNYLLPGLVALLPSIIGLLSFPSLANVILSLGTSSDVSEVMGSTTLSKALSSVPFLQYMALGVYDDLAFVILVLLTIVGSYQIIKSRQILALIPIGWFLVLFATAPSSLIAWRFSLEAIVPFTLLASYGIYVTWITLRNSGKTGFGRRVRSGRASGRSPLLVMSIMILIVGSLILGSYGTSIVGSEISNGSVNYQSQDYVYSAIYWLKGNTPNGSRYLSVSDWRFTYTDLIIGRNTYYEYAVSPSDAMKIAMNESASYIIVTNVTTLTLPPVPSLFPWNNFPIASNSNLTLLMSNPDVRIYQIVNLT